MTNKNNKIELRRIRCRQKAPWTKVMQINLTLNIALNKDKWRISQPKIIWIKIMIIIMIEVCKFDDNVYEMYLITSEYISD